MQRGASDPSWGSGLSVTLLDVEHLASALQSCDDWNVAIAHSAREHDRYNAALHRIHTWMTDLAWTPGSRGRRSSRARDAEVDRSGRRISGSRWTGAVRAERRAGAADDAWARLSLRREVQIRPSARCARIRAGATLGMTKRAALSESPRAPPVLESTVPRPARRRTVSRWFVLRLQRDGLLSARLDHEHDAAIELGAWHIA